MENLSKKTQERIKSLREHILNGAASVKELAELEGLSESYTLTLLPYTGFSLRPKSWQTRDKILKAHEEGKDTAEIAKALDITKESVTGYLREMHLNKKRGRVKGETGGNLLRNQRIEAGLSIGEIGRLEEKDRRTIYQYICYHGKLDSWKEKRKEARAKAKMEETEKKAVIYKIVSSVIANKILSNYEDKEAAQKVVEYTAAHSDTHKSYNQLYAIFSRYYEAQRKGEKCSLEGLCDDTGVSIMTTSRILKAVGLSTFYKPGQTK